MCRNVRHSNISLRVCTQQTDNAWLLRRAYGGQHLLWNSCVDPLHGITRTFASFDQRQRTGLRKPGFLGAYGRGESQIAAHGIPTQSHFAGRITLLQRPLTV